MSKPQRKAESNVDFKNQQLDKESELYINMLCDRYKNRGVTVKVKKDAKRIEGDEGAPPKSTHTVRGIDSPEDASRYKSGSFMGVSYMTSDDFAEYYRQRRGFNTLRAVPRAQSEYDEIARADKEKKAEKGDISPKKELWLAIVYETKTRVKAIKDKLNAEGLREVSDEWFPLDKREDRREGKKSHFPKKSIPAFIIITLSLLLIVSGSIMVSHAEIEVSKLENRIIAYERERDELNSKLKTKSDLMEIREWAISEGMVSREYLNSKYIEIENGERTEVYEKEADDGIIKTFLKAIGLITDEE